MASPSAQRKAARTLDGSGGSSALECILQRAPLAAYGSKKAASRRRAATRSPARSDANRLGHFFTRHVDDTIAPKEKAGRATLDRLLVARGDLPATAAA